DPAIKGASAPSARGKESLTILKVLERYRIATLTECRLVTGRHHQLRVHVAAIGHPLLVDKLYGGEEAFFLSSIKKKFNIGREKEERPTITRISMHAYSIGFKHPDSGELIKFSAPYPKDLEVMVQLLSKYASMPDHFSPGP
ncbi:MAG: pseudouridine synthase, partial [Bacteroidota bacterium]